jgi:hypothetical protein
MLVSVRYESDGWKKLEFSCGGENPETIPFKQVLETVNREFHGIPIEKLMLTTTDEFEFTIHINRREH